MVSEGQDTKVNTHTLFRNSQLPIPMRSERFFCCIFRCHLYQIPRSSTVKECGHEIDQIYLDVSGLSDWEKVMLKKAAMNVAGRKTR